MWLKRCLILILKLVNVAIDECLLDLTGQGTSNR